MIHTGTCDLFQALFDHRTQQGASPHIKGKLNSCGASVYVLPPWSASSGHPHFDLGQGNPEFSGNNKHRLQQLTMINFETAIHYHFKPRLMR